MIKKGSVEYWNDGIMNIVDYVFPKILRFASATAAIKCTKIGGRSGIPDLQSVNNFLQMEEIQR
jgi:sugar/nucleoside kinase (ribokinase family)